MCCVVLCRVVLCCAVLCCVVLCCVVLCCVVFSSRVDTARDACVDFVAVVSQAKEYVLRHADQSSAKGDAIW